MTPEDINTVANASAKKAVEATFLLLGVDVTDADAVKAAQLDFAHLRAWRESINQVKTKTIGTAVTVIVTGLLGYLWLAFRGGGN
jgi:hypothetical protein